jgi:hypothetical protein
MNTQFHPPDPERVKQSTVKLRQHRLAIEESTLILEELAAQLEQRSRQKYLNRLSRLRSNLTDNSEISKA